MWSRITIVFCWRNCQMPEAAINSQGSKYGTAHGMHLPGDVFAFADLICTALQGRRGSCCGWWSWSPREDQDKINKFSRLHQREMALEEELKTKHVCALADDLRQQQTDPCFAEGERGPGWCIKRLGARRRGRQDTVCAISISRSASCANSIAATKLATHSSPFHYQKSKNYYPRRRVKSSRMLKRWRRNSAPSGRRWQSWRYNYMRGLAEASIWRHSIRGNTIMIPITNTFYATREARSEVWKIFAAIQWEISEVVADSSWPRSFFRCRWNAFHLGRSAVKEAFCRAVWNWIRPWLEWIPGLFVWRCIFQGWRSMRSFKQYDEDVWLHTHQLTCKYDAMLFLISWPGQ